MFLCVWRVGLKTTQGIGPIKKTSDLIINANENLMDLAGLEVCTCAAARRQNTLCASWYGAAAEMLQPLTYSWWTSL